MLYIFCEKSLLSSKSSCHFSFVREWTAYHLELKKNSSMESNFTSEFQNPLLHENARDECLRYQKHFEGNKNHAIAICVVNIPICLTALFGNYAVLITIWKTPSLHKPSYILLASLAVSDFAVGLIVQPLFISLLLTVIYGLPPPTFHFICMSFTAMAYALCGVSLYSITAIGLDRFLALRLHLRYNAIVTTFRVKLAITGIWLLPGISVFNSFWSTEIYLKVIAILSCVFMLANFVIYFKIHLIVRHHQAQIQHQHLEANAGNTLSFKKLKKSALNTSLVFIVFIFCYAPHSYVLLTGRTSLTVHYATATIALLHSSLNPLLYCWRVAQIRTATKQILCNCVC